MNDILLKCINVTKVFEKNSTLYSVLLGVNLTVIKGEVVCIHGQSGAGKSVLLSLLSGIDRPTSGDIYYANNIINKFSLKELAQFRRQKIGIIFQNFNLISYWTALENVEAVLDDKRMSGKQKRLLAESILSDLGLAHRLKNYPQELSMGEQQRVAIARTLIKCPELILADEPTGEVDKETAGIIMNMLLRDIHEKRTTIIITTHNHFSLNFAHRKLLLEKGQLYEKQHT